jgi:endo-1,4-beta-xylanase
VIGDAYIPIAFRAAAAADPSAQLFYNDYSKCMLYTLYREYTLTPSLDLEYGQAKHQGALRIVKLIQSYGIKISGVGLQGHMTSESTGTQSVSTPSVKLLTSTLQDYANLGVNVAYTELDIRSNTPTTSQKLTDGANAWARMAQSCINVSRCIGITIWGGMTTFNAFDWRNHC